MRHPPTPSSARDSFIRTEIQLLWQAVQTKQPAQIADMTKLQAYVEGDPWYTTVSLGGHRGALSVPMLHED